MRDRKLKRLEANMLGKSDLWRIMMSLSPSEVRNRGSGWKNWHINRGRMPQVPNLLPSSMSERRKYWRQVSWRRVL